MTLNQRIYNAIERAKGSFSIPEGEPLCPREKVHIREIAYALERLLTEEPLGPCDYVPEAYELILDALLSRGIIARTFEEDATVPPAIWQEYSRYPEGAYFSDFWCGAFSGFVENKAFANKHPVVDRNDAENWLKYLSKKGRSTGAPKKCGVVEAYRKIYPNGSKDSWKEIARKVGQEIGESVSPDTIKRRLGLKK